MDRSAPELPAGSADALARIRFVLVEPSLSGNIGAVARAMKTMGLSRLGIVRQPAADGPVPAAAEALARAAGADDLLAAAEVQPTLDAALGGCRLVIGSSARPRSVRWPQLSPRRCAALLLDEAAHGDVALLLGRERSGLSNAELGRCHYLVQIPANPAFSSLNIAAAAQVFAYELRMAALERDEAHATASPTPCATGSTAGGDGPGDAGFEAPLATADEMAGFYDHLEQTLVDTGFADPAQSRRLQQRLRRLFNRARPDRTEINILRGLLSAALGRKRADRFQRRQPR
jgi:tRNA (cytidine32/uridine32-2'-O)-methyltransferase